VPSFQFNSETRGLERARWLLSLVCAASVAGCAQGVGTLPVAGPSSAHAAGINHARYADAPIVYAFEGSPDGSTPYAGLTDVGGTLYGMTAGGGTAYQGIVFSVTPGGTETVLHSFTGIPDGGQPQGGLINVAGTLYGTTSGGGARGDGTIFSITTSGKEKVLYSFGTTANDGINPAGDLLYSGGALYGTTVGGGNAEGVGTVFKFALTGKKAGKETLLHSFAGGLDGSDPQSALIEYKGAFYGTTVIGGSASGGGDGTVFKVTPAGKETVLHAFTGEPDGHYAHAALIAYSGNFYGMTEQGGAKDLGTVFKMTPKGKLTIIHSFANSAGEGYGPRGSTLLNVNGKFYGTVPATYTGSGAIFEITPSGSESLVYVFNYDVAPPYSNVIDVGGLLYGTTINGGPADQGTVYAVPL
jgi:uncharacterized repeat protein (TIGR03803 family)